MLTLRKLLSEPYRLAMSSGFFGFFSHAGLMSVLQEESLLPTAVSGSSAGALVAGLFAGGVDPAEMRKLLFRLRREDFWDPSPGLGLLRGQLFRRILEETLVVHTFEATRIPLAVSVFDVASRTTHVRNQGELASAIAASCAVPLMFHPVWIDGRAYLDGGISDRPGTAGLAGHSGLVLHHHLASKSPWRFAVPLPAAAHVRSLVLPNLPRLGPFRLHRGPLAFDETVKRVRAALDQPIPASGPIFG